MTELKEEQEKIRLRVDSETPVDSSTQGQAQFEDLQPAKPPRKAKSAPVAIAGKPKTKGSYIAITIFGALVCVTLAFGLSARFTGDDYMERGSLPLAIECYKRDASAATQAPTPSAKNHVALAQIYLKKNMLGDSMRYAEEGLAIAKDKQEMQQLHQAKGIVYVDRSEWANAINEFNLSKPENEKADLAPEQERLLFNARIGTLIASVHLNNEAEITRLLKDLHMVNTKGDNVNIEDARYSFLAGRNAEARALLESEIKRLGPDINRWTRGRLYELLGDIDLAEEKYDDAVEHYALTEYSHNYSDCRFVDKRSRAYRKLGDLANYKLYQSKLAELHGHGGHQSWEQLQQTDHRYLRDRYFFGHAAQMIRRELGLRCPELRHGGHDGE